jgi:hypothetical protein
MKTNPALINRRKFLLLAGAVALGATPSALRLSPLPVSAQGSLDKFVYLPLVLSDTPTLQVGPTRALKTPSAAAAVAKDGDIIEIDAGLYTGDVATWKQNNLTLRGTGGLAHLDANGNNAGGKAIWVIQGNNTTIEAIEFSGATVPDRNGAGIRQEGANLTVRGCYFHDNEDGILAGDNASSQILIEYSQFANNGYGDGYTHNLYINHVNKLTFQFCYTHHAKIGHLLKSRAYQNYILYNRIMDEASGTASYEIDLPNGGLSYIIGNLVQQGSLSDNPTIIAYAEEGASNPLQEIYVVNNTIVNERSGGTFLWVAGTPTALAVNNLFVGSGTPISGTVTADHNLSLPASTLVSAATYNYHLATGSTAINGGRDPGSGHGFSLSPAFEYVHPCDGQPRVNAGTIDVGAYEYH